MKKLFLLPLSLFVLCSCVPKDQYEALAIERDYYRNKTVEADSLADVKALNTYEEVDNADADRAEMIRKMESLTATNRALNESYQSLSTRYQDLLAQDQKLLTNTGEEVTGLQQSLAERTLEISKREAELREIKISLDAREQAIARIEGDVMPAGGGQAKGNDRVGAVNLTARQNAALRLNSLQNELNQLLGYLPAGSYIVAPAGNNRLQITLSESLITSDGYAMSTEGATLLRRLAGTLRNYPNSDISVIGHADGSESDAQMAYEDSTDKAISIAQQLVDLGINPGKIVAGGKGFYAPVTDSSTPDGRLANRRLDFLITVPE